MYLGDISSHERSEHTHFRPPQPWYEATWDVSRVLDFGVDMGPSRALTLRDITWKLAMILALTRPSRSADLAKLDPRRLLGHMRRRRGGFRQGNAEQMKLFLAVVTTQASDLLDSGQIAKVTRYRHRHIQSPHSKGSCHIGSSQCRCHYGRYPESSRLEFGVCFQKVLLQAYSIRCVWITSAVQ